MALTIDSRFKQGALDGGLARLNAGSGASQGNLEFLTSGDSSLAMLALSATSFAPATIAGANATAASNAISPAANPVAGTIAKGRLRDRDNNSILAFSVSLAAGSGDMKLGAVAIQPGTTSISCSGIVVTAAFA